MYFKKALFVFLLFVIFPVFSVSAEDGINAFDARIKVNKNATIEVTERIAYDFGAQKKHGIYREIPYSYQAGTETYTADVTSVIVTDGIGNPMPFGESRGNGTLTIKIGDPDVLVTGEQVYVISYIVKGPFLYFDDHDELYWNVTGFWQKPIVHASVLVDLPLGAKIISASCYKGVEGSNEKCDKDERLINAERAGYTASAENLKPNEGFTVAVAFPKGVIKEIKKPWEKKASGFIKWWPVSIPFITFFVMLYLWFTKGRDPKESSVIVTEFEAPEDISPALAQVVYKDLVTPKAVSAEIIRLAVDGYIKIHRFKKKHLIFSTTEYLFEKIKEEKPEDEISAIVFDKIFQKEFETTEEIDGKEVKGVLLSKMSNNFKDELKDIKDKIYKSVVSDKKYFISRPDKKMSFYGKISSLLTFAGFAAFIFKDNIIYGLSFIFSSFIIAIFSHIMPAKTPLGAEIKQKLKGLKKYLEVAEKDRIEFHNAPEKNPKLFDKLLPFAMIFGVEKKWAKQFEDIYKDEPDWYSGGDGSFVATSFVSDLNTFSSDFSSAVAPRSSGASGGGSSGGGFGGGGGGSW